MRLLPMLVAGLAMATQTVSAQCTGLWQGTPSANAVVFFLSGVVTKGSFQTTVYGGLTPGLAGADNTCNSDATAGGRTPRVAALGGSNLFRAVLSNQNVNARDRFISGPTTPSGISTVDPTWDVIDSNGNCLAAQVSDLFDCSHIGTIDFNTAFADSTGVYYNNSLTRVWTGSTCDGQRWHIENGITDQVTIQQSYCSTATTPNINDGGWSGTANGVQGHIGAVFETTVPVGSDWIDLGNYGCSNGLHLYCMQVPAPPTPTPTSNVHGDPQFTGLQGQAFQVHGMPDEFFNLITAPDMQLNSRFAYLASGTCNYNNTDCWTHPGTYVDQLGFMFPSLRIKAVAGSHDDGMIVHINDARVSVTEQPMEYTIGEHVHAGSHASNQTQGQTVRVSHPKHDVLMVQTDMFTVTATNSDMFFNFGVEMHDRELLSAGSAIHHVRDAAEADSKYPKFPIHGLLGQTWRNARYKHGQLFQGSVDDYMILDSRLFSNKFLFNQYQH